MHENHTYELTELPKGKKALLNKWEKRHSGSWLYAMVCTMLNITYAVGGGRIVAVEVVEG